MGNTTGIGGSVGGAGVGGAGGGGAAGGGLARGAGTGASGRAAPDARTRATLRWVVSGERPRLDKTLAKAARKGCRAANTHLTWRGGTRAHGDVRPHAEGALIVVRVEVRSERLKGVPLGVALRSFTEGFEAHLAGEGVRARRLGAERDVDGS